MEAWRTARIAELIDEFGEEQLMEWHGTEAPEALWDTLLDFSDEVLVDRFSQIDDLVSRVLGGGVANRWLTRLRPTEQWMAERLGQPVRSRRLFGALLRSNSIEAADGIKKAGGRSSTTAGPGVASSAYKAPALQPSTRALTSALSPAPPETAMPRAPLSAFLP